MISNIFSVLVVAVLVVFSPLSVSAKKKSTEPDPRDCEVCINNLNAVDALLSPSEKSDKVAIRNAIGKRCTKSGFGSEWKPNPELTDPKYESFLSIFNV